MHLLLERNVSRKSSLVRQFASSIHESWSIIYYSNVCAKIPVEYFGLISIIGLFQRNVWIFNVVLPSFPLFIKCIWVRKENVFRSESVLDTLLIEIERSLDFWSTSGGVKNNFKNLLAAWIHLTLIWTFNFVSTKWNREKTHSSKRQKLCFVNSEFFYVIH